MKKIIILILIMFASFIFIACDEVKEVDEVETITQTINEVPEVENNPHEWVNLSGGLIAHAGGCLEMNGELINPPNCKEVMNYSYANGQRVFEFDFNLTTDGKLAVVHDWAGWSGMKSSEEWREIKIWDVFTSMMLDDVLDFMLEHDDIYLITDTKSFEYTEDQIREQFHILVQAAKEKDPSLKLLERIVPQIYNRPMYDIIIRDYKFNSIIYTLYATPDTEEEVLDFVKSHDDIKVITMAPPRNNETFVKNLNDAGKYIYLHTINDLQEIKAYKASGIWGFYTDFVFPKDLLD